MKAVTTHVFSVIYSLSCVVKTGFKLATMFFEYEDVYGVLHSIFIY